MAMGNAKDEYDDSAIIDGDEDELEDDDLEEEEQEESDDSEEEEADEDDEEGEDAEDGEEEADDEEEPAKDKKENKIVALKRQIKEANKRIAEMEQAKEDGKADEVAEQKRKDMLDEGYSEADVEEFIKTYKENALLKQKLDGIQRKELADKYPNITKYWDKIDEVRKSLPEASIEDIYLSKFSKNSAYDEKTRIEQELLFKKGKSSDKSKSSVKGGQQKAEVVKLSASDERAYKEAIKFNPSMSKKDFLTLLKEEELT